MARQIQIGVSLSSIEIIQLSQAADERGGLSLSSMIRLVLIPWLEKHARDADELAYETAPIALCRFNTKLEYVQINARLAAINGLSMDEHLGRAISDVLPDVAAGVSAQLCEVLETGEPVYGEAHITTPAHPGVRRLYRHRYSPELSDGDVVGVCCVVEDITDSRPVLPAPAGQQTT